MSPAKRLIPDPYEFRLLKAKLSDLGIIWDRSRGKGSHGVFMGEDMSGRPQCFPIPRNQQKQVHKSVLNKLRRRFQLDGSRWDAFFAARKTK